ncbi:MAG TPA: choice-of-anchor tandem repeat GloVer-containing protein [Candidatus Sulfotelmatobacter sp.]|nr:choice-of-anchor tandem repeat GloVer-containing protein [Candidatus Sulfotelmatobacter sp.]
MKAFGTTLRTLRTCRIFCGVILFWAITTTASRAQTLTTLAAFDGANGNNPLGLIQGFDGNLYGTTSMNQSGTVFKITSGGALTTLHQFCSGGNN